MHRLSILVCFLFSLAVKAQTTTPEDFEVDFVTSQSAAKNPTEIFCHLPNEAQFDRKRAAFKLIPGTLTAQHRDSMRQKSNQEVRRRTDMGISLSAYILPGEMSKWEEFRLNHPKDLAFFSLVRLQSVMSILGIRQSDIGSVTVANAHFAPGIAFAKDNNAFIKFNDHNGRQIKTVRYSESSYRSIPDFVECLSADAPDDPPGKIKDYIWAYQNRVHSLTLSQVETVLNKHIVNRYGCCADLDNVVALGKMDGVWIQRASAPARPAMVIQFSVLQSTKIERAICTFKLKVEGGIAVYDTHDCQDISVNAKSDDEEIVEAFPRRRDSLSWPYARGGALIELRMRSYLPLMQLKKVHAVLWEHTSGNFQDLTLKDLKPGIDLNGDSTISFEYSVNASERQPARKEHCTFVFTRAVVDIFKSYSCR